MANLKLRFAQQGTAILMLLTLLILSVAMVAPAAAQSNEGFGVGSGHGAEVGINLPVLEQVRADVAAGVYDRACSAEEHDPTKWHSLVNVEARCHYDHHHGDDPHYVNDIFGQPGAWFQSSGQSISYPWQTFPAQDRFESNAAYLGTGKMENEAKHEGYQWVVRRDQPCNTDSGQYCVKDFRVQFHGMMVGMGAATRWHSMSAEVRVCRNVNDASSCGIIRTGGWMDHGRLFTVDAAAVGNRALCAFDAQNTGQFRQVSLPVDNQYYPFQSNSNPLDEERCHPILTPQMIANGPRTGSFGDGPKAEWWVHGASDFRFQLSVGDPLGNVYETAPGSGQLQNDLFCNAEDPTCMWTQSIVTMRLQYLVPIANYWVQGHTNGTNVTLGLEDGRYINRFGGINENCSAPGLDCIPIEYNNLQTNVAPGAGQAGFSHTPCENCEKVNHNVSPSDEQWITWFYKKFQGYTPPVEPPAQPDDPEGPAIFFAVNSGDASQMSVNLRLIDVANVYGVQAECQVNPTVLQGAGLTTDGAFTEANSFILDDGFQADGSWRVAATHLKPNPAISGDALAFTLNYTVAQTGDGELACSALAVDENGKQIELEVVNGSAIILPPSNQEPTDPIEEPPVIVETGSINGLVAYQNRPDNSGIIVKLLGIGDSTLSEVTTAADGSYSFPDLPTGQYRVQLMAPQHIDAIKDITIESADAIVQLEDLLRAGDVDDSGLIDMVDVTLVGANFGLEAIEEIGNVDLNDDGTINVSDLSLVGGNLDLAAPATSNP